MIENQSLVYLLLGMVLLWLTGLSLAFYKAFGTYKALTKDIDKKDIATVLKQIKLDLSKLDKNHEALLVRLNTLDQDLKTFVQKVGFVRYNPFGNTGGDHSFCLCLLDGYDNGVLMTSLHTRQQTRIYTKQIIKGVSAEKAELSIEEKLCLKKAKEWSKQ